jgi:hypothetical protein
MLILAGGGVGAPVGDGVDVGVGKISGVGVTVWVGTMVGVDVKSARTVGIAV